MKSISLNVPISETEQSTIATILSTIDQAIEKTEQLIAKYERIKTGLMQDLLTRGIDEQGRIRREETHQFKDSALGRVPVEWEVVTLKAACERIQDGTHFSPEISEVGEFMYITSKNIRMGELDLNNVDFITREAHDSIFRRCSVKYRDVLLTKDGANTGNVSLNTIKEPISLLSSVAFLRGKKGYLKNDFLFQVLASEKLQKTFKDQMSGNAITRTTLTKINATLITVPKVDEQDRIISVLEKFGSNLFKEKNNLMKYQSMKTALMQDLLTGRVRVNKMIG
ncbi:MAG: restriction endonuclease subunit S [Saprospiraceae bacterium]|nr:restriction endonuclease subunit S [Saprospiraceae bacterium]